MKSLLIHGITFMIFMNMTSGLVLALDALLGSKEYRILAVPYFISLVLFWIFLVASYVMEY